MYIIKKPKYSSSQMDLFKTILTLEQDELHTMLMNFLKDFYSDDDIIESFGEYIFVQGDIAVLLVAHLDTVHFQKPKIDEIFLDHEKGIMWSPVGIGGDDRCGVFIILNLLLRGFKPYISFVWDEEKGCVGSSKMVRDINCQELDFAIQFDRKGFAEAVYYDLDSPEFEKYISSFGFQTNIGSFSDISEICPEWDMAGVNLSAGYDREHTSSETIYLNVLYDTMLKSCKILEDQQKNPTYFKYQESKGASRYPLYSQCSNCKIYLEKTKLILIKNNFERYMCQNCYYKF